MEAEMKSDPDVVMVIMKLKLKKDHGPRLKLNLEKLRDPQSLSDCDSGETNPSV